MNFPERTIKSCCIVSYCIVYNRAVSSLTDTTNTSQTPPPKNVYFHHRRLAPRPQIISFSVFAQRRAQWQISGLVNEDLFCQPALSSSGGLRPGRSSVCGLWLAPRTPSNTRSHCSYQRCTKRCILHLAFLNAKLLHLTCGARKRCLLLWAFHNAKPLQLPIAYTARKRCILLWAFYNEKPLQLPSLRCTKPLHLPCCCTKTLPFTFGLSQREATAAA